MILRTYCEQNSNQLVEMEIINSLSNLLHKKVCDFPTFFELKFLSSVFFLAVTIICIGKTDKQKVR